MWNNDNLDLITLGSGLSFFIKKFGKIWFAMALAAILLSRGHTMPARVLCLFRMNDAGIFCNFLYFATVRLAILMPSIFNLSTIGYAIPGSVLAVSLLLVFSFYFDLSITVFGMWGLFLCLVIRFITPLIRYLDAALSSMTEETLSATRIYSRSLLKTFKSIYFPALYPSLLLGFLVVFIEVIKEQPATLLLRPVGFDTLSSKIYNFTSEGQWELAATPSIAIILLSLILVLILNNRVDNE